MTFTRKPSCVGGVGTVEGRDDMLGFQGNLEQVQVTEGYVPGWLGIEFTLGLR